MSFPPGEVPITERELGEQAKASAPAAITDIAPPVVTPVMSELPVIIAPVKAATTPLKVNVSLGDLASEPDSFKRQKDALLHLARYLKRVPTVAEALEIARDVARKLIEARSEREGALNLPTTSERRDYTIVVAA